MLAYASRTGTRRNLAALRAAGWRLMLSPAGVLRDEGFAYALDNGAWSAFNQRFGVRVESERFEQHATERRDAELRDARGARSAASADADEERRDERGQLQARQSEARSGGEDLADTDARRRSRVGSRDDNDRSDAPGDVDDGRLARTYWETRRCPFPAIRGMDDGLSNRVDRLEALGNAVVWQQARRAFELLAGLEAS